METSLFDEFQRILIARCDNSGASGECECLRRQPQTNSDYYASDDILNEERYVKKTDMVSPSLLKTDFNAVLEFRLGRKNWIV